MKKYLIPLGIGVLLIATLLTIFLTGKSSDESSTVVTLEDPLDVTLDFYGRWHDAALSTTTGPYAANLLSDPLVSPELAASISAARAEGAETSIDPVLCQPTVPPRIGGKTLFQLDDQAQIMILARGLDERSPYQAVVTLRAVAGNWQFTDISCATGEVAPEREYDFEQEGFLLKSVPPPLDPTHWHLVFEQGGVMGHTVPLFFTEGSLCIATDGVEAPCLPDTFTEATKAYVQADMTEAGAVVKRLRF